MNTAIKETGIMSNEELIAYLSESYPNLSDLKYRNNCLANGNRILPINEFDLHSFVEKNIANQILDSTTSDNFLTMVENDTAKTDEQEVEKQNPVADMEAHLEYTRYLDDDGIEHQFVLVTDKDGIDKKLYECELNQVQMIYQNLLSFNGSVTSNMMNRFMLRKYPLLPLVSSHYVDNSYDNSFDEEFRHDLELLETKNRENGATKDVLGFIKPDGNNIYVLGDGKLVHHRENQEGLIQSSIANDNENFINTQLDEELELTAPDVLSNPIEEEQLVAKISMKEYYDLLANPVELGSEEMQEIKLIEKDIFEIYSIKINNASILMPDLEDIINEYLNYCNMWEINPDASINEKEALKRFHQRQDDLSNASQLNLDEKKVRYLKPKSGYIQASLLIVATVISGILIALLFMK